MANAQNCGRQAGGEGLVPTMIVVANGATVELLMTIAFLPTIAKAIIDKKILLGKQDSNQLTTFISKILHMLNFLN